MTNVGVFGLDYKYDHMIGEKIRAFRMARSLTQEQLVLELQLLDCDISRSTLANIESGLRHIYSWEIKAFKEVLNVSYEDLFV